MDVSSLSSSVSGAGDALGMSALRTALNTEATSTMQLLQAMPPPPEPGKGGSVDCYA